MRTCGHSIISRTQLFEKHALLGVYFKMMENGDSAFWRLHLCRLEHNCDIFLRHCSFSAAQPNPRNYGTTFATIFATIYVTAYSAPVARTLKMPKSSITGFGSLNRTWSRHSENTSGISQTCQSLNVPGTTKLKIPSLASSSTTTMIMNELWLRSESHNSTPSNTMHIMKSLHLLNHKLAACSSSMDRVGRGRHLSTIRSATQSTVGGGLCCVLHCLELPCSFFMVVVPLIQCSRFHCHSIRTPPALFPRRGDSHH